MQELIVALIVGYSVWVVVNKYAPKRMRQTVRALSVRTLDAVGLGTLARRLEATAATASSTDTGACGKCGGCGDTDAAPVAKEFAITPDALKRTIRR